MRDFEVFDLVPTSTWKKFATYMHDAGDRESGTNMLHLEILSVKPVPELAASEIVVKVSGVAQRRVRVLKKGRRRCFHYAYTLTRTRWTL